MFSSVCETSVPSTTGRFSRGRPVRRATTSARDGSPSRAGSVEDISTPIIVPCIASSSRIRARGSAALRIAYHENARSDHRAAHRREPEQHERRARVEQRGGDVAEPDLLQRRVGEARRRRASPPPARRGAPARPRGRGARSAAARGSAAAARGRARLQVGRRAARPGPRRAARAVCRGGRRDRVLVGLHHLARRPAARRTARRRGAAARAISARRSGSSYRSRSASASACASPGGTSTPSTPSRTTSR